MKNERYPQYVRIALNVASRIAGGELPEHHKLPSAAELSAEYNASRDTVRRTLKLLAGVGAVTMREGYGAAVLSAAKARDRKSVV